MLPAGASESQCARSGEWRIRAGWLLRPLGSRAPGTDPIATSIARLAIRNPHLSAIVVSGSGRLRGFADTETSIDRGTTSSTAVQRAAPTGRGPLGLRLGLCALPWRVVAHFCGPPLRQKYPICRYFLRWRDPDSNRGHHDFQQLLAHDDRAGLRPSGRSLAHKAALCPARAPTAWNHAEARASDPLRGCRVAPRSRRELAEQRDSRCSSIAQA